MNGTIKVVLSVLLFFIAVVAPTVFAQNEMVSVFTDDFSDNGNNWVESQNVVVDGETLRVRKSSTYQYALIPMAFDQDALRVDVNVVGLPTPPSGNEVTIFLGEIQKYYDGYRDQQPATIVWVTINSDEIKVYTLQQGRRAFVTAMQMPETEGTVQVSVEYWHDDEQLNVFIDGGLFVISSVLLNPTMEIGLGATSRNNSAFLASFDDLNVSEIISQ